MPADPKTQERVRGIADEAIARLAADLKAGRSESLEEYLAAMGRFHRYSWNNSLLIHSQRPTATRVAGYHTWNELGRHVRRGEKGIVIYAPLLTKAKEHEVARGSAARDPGHLRVRGFRAAYVFDVEQTDGKPLPAFAQTQGDPQEYGTKLKAWAAEQGIALTYDPSIAPADGLSVGGAIRIRPGLSPAEEFSVLSHELAHELLHRGPDRAALPKVVRETQAEAVAYVVSRGIGLEAGRAAADYISLYHGNEKTLVDSLAAIQEASSKILNALLPREPEQPERTTDRSATTLHASERPGRTDGITERPLTTPEAGDGLSMER